MRGAPIDRPFRVRYGQTEIVRSAREAATALPPVTDVVEVRSAISRADAIAQAARSLADSGLILGRGEEIRFRVEDR